ncbi:MAG: YceI family protein [Chitinophagales bacterium]|jgi:polyisoprenoid-binding protein YceI|nr:YceI family protein [Chitinophagales bacterium]HNI45466.1 YceI family protein [Chitinophagales bacterium]HNL06690.1 YceI family protein [Chitinophagales bacterium]
MNKIVLFFVVLSGIVLGVGCNQAPKADQAQVQEAQQAPSAATDAVNYKVDAAQSQIGWLATKKVGKHNGIFGIKEGSLQVKDGQVQGGKVIIDVNSVKVLDLTGEDQQKLEGHLKDVDFFETAKYPEATFEITSVSKYDAAAGGAKPMLDGVTHNITGNLTMKGVAKSVTFPAIVEIGADGNVGAKAVFNINRNDWNIVYNNKESLGDKFILPDVNLTLKLVAVKG